MRFIPLYIIWILTLASFSIAQAQDERHIKIGLEAERKQQYPKALRHFNKAIRKEPGNFQGYFHRGRIKYVQKDYQGAISDFTIAVGKTDKEKNNIYFNRARVKTDMGDYHGAIDDNTLALNLNARNPNALLNRGIAYAFIKNYRNAVRDFSAALKLDPDNARIYDSRAIAYDQLGELENAKRDYTKAMELDPARNRYLDIGILCDRLGEYQNALAAFSKCLAINPNDTLALFNRSLVKLALEDMDGALKDNAAVIRLDSAFTNVFYQKGHLHYQSGDYTQAIAAFTKAIRFNPRDEYSYYSRGNSWAKLEEYQKAISDYTTAINMLPLDVVHDHPSANEMEVAFYYDRSVARHVLNDNSGAIEDISVALAKNPLDVKAYSQRSYYHFVLKHYDQSLADIRKAIALDPENIDHKQVLAQILLVSGQYESAFQLSVGELKNVPANDTRTRTTILFVVCASGKILHRDITAYEPDLHESLNKDFSFPSIQSFKYFRDAVESGNLPEPTRVYVQALLSKLGQKIKPEKD